MTSLTMSVGLIGCRFCPLLYRGVGSSRDMRIIVCLLVDLGDDEVAPVDEGDHLSHGEGLGVGSVHQNLGSVPHLLHPDLGVLPPQKSTKFPLEKPSRQEF